MNGLLSILQIISPVNFSHNCWRLLSMAFFLCMRFDAYNRSPFISSPSFSSTCILFSASSVIRFCRMGVESTFAIMFSENPG